MNTLLDCWATTIGYTMDVAELVTGREAKLPITITGEHNGFEQESKSGSVIEVSTFMPKIRCQKLDA